MKVVVYINLMSFTLKMQRAIYTAYNKKQFTWQNKYEIKDTIKGVCNIAWG